MIGVLAHETGHIAGGHLARSREAMGQSMRPALISIGLGVLAIAAGAPDAGARAHQRLAGAFAQGNYVRHTQVQESRVRPSRRAIISNAPANRAKG